MPWNNAHEAMDTITKNDGCCRMSGLFIFRVLDSIGLVTVMAVQLCLLNFLMIKYDDWKIRNYFWFIGDGILLVLLIITLVISYRVILEQVHRKLQHIDIPLIEVPMYGVLPFGYITWFIYAVWLVAKVAVIFRSTIVEQLPIHGIFSTIGVKVILALTVVIFILMVNTHHDAEPNSERNNYIADLCKGTAFDLFDSISFLSFLLFNETKLNEYELYNLYLRDAIIALSCLNFLLPTLSLVKLSLSEFGELEQPLRLSLLVKTCKLFLINLPFMIIRIYLWETDDGISLFLVKNILYVVISLRFMIPEYHHACKYMHEKHNGTCRRSSNRSSRVAAVPSAKPLEMMHIA